MSKSQRRISTAILQSELEAAHKELEQARKELAIARGADSASIVASREPYYGNPKTNFALAASILNGVLGYKLKVSLTPDDIGLIMIGVKLARLARTPHHRDSLDDIVGYVRCHQQVLHCDPNELEHVVAREAYADDPRPTSG